MPARNDTPLTEAQKQLAADNFGLAWKAVRTFRGEYWDFDHLRSAALEGLVHAARSFDPARGFRFSTYAIPAMHMHMKRAATDTLIKVPKYLVDDPRSAGDRDVCRARDVISLSEIVPSVSGCLCLADTVADSRYDRDGNAVEREDDESEDIHRAIDMLPPRHRQALALHLTGMSYAEIASEFGVRRESARDMVRRARTKMQTFLNPQSRAG